MQQPAYVNYHVQRDTPQAFYFDVGGIKGNLQSPTLEKTKIHVTDMRGKAEKFDFLKNGIAFKRHASKVTDFTDPTQWQGPYDLEIEKLIKDITGAKEVMVFDHTVRIDADTATRGPARNVHNDYSPQGARQRAKDILGAEKAAEYEEGHYGVVNIWRPIAAPVLVAPLAFVRPSSMQPEDWMPIGLVYPDRQGQILGVAANDQHEWFYMSKMTPQDIVIFNTYDNKGLPYFAHSALDLDTSSALGQVRKSIESRCLVRYR